MRLHLKSQGSIEVARTVPTPDPLSAKEKLPSWAPRSFTVVRPARSPITGLYGALSRSIRATVIGSMLLLGAAGLNGCVNQPPQGAPLPDTTMGGPEAPQELGEFRPEHLKRYGLYRLFWETPGDSDLSGEGLYEVTVAGASKLYQYARTHDLEGAERPDGPPSVGARAVIRALLQHPQYSAYFQPQARAKLGQLFGLPSSVVESVALDLDRGQLLLEARVSERTVAELTGTLIDALPAAFRDEYQRRQAELEGGGSTDEEKSRRVLGLLRDYAAALWSHAQLPTTDRVAAELLDAFEATRYGLVQGRYSYNGAPWGAAQGLVLGVLDPNTFPTHFPRMVESLNVTAFGLDGEMARPMRWVDRYRAAVGLPTGAAGLEGASPINRVIGEVDGHNKVSELFEMSPFGTSGINWGLVLWPNDPEVRGLRPKPGFEFPIDFVGASGELLSLDRANGDRLVIVDQKGRAVRAEKVVQDGPYTARFFDEAGVELPPRQVKGVFLDARGKLKGDGQVTGSLPTTWWGFCDHVASQSLLKTRYSIPQLDRAEIRVRAGGTILKVPKDDAQAIFDSGLPSVMNTETYGFRFDNGPLTLKLKDGRTIVGTPDLRLYGEAPYLTGAGPGPWVADQRRLEHQEGNPILGLVSLVNIPSREEAELFALIQLNATETVLRASDIVKITKRPDGRVQIATRSGEEYSGNLKTEVDWSAAQRLPNGDRVLVQDDTFPIRGEFQLVGPNGRVRVPAAEVVSVEGESPADLSLAGLIAWISKKGGLTAADSSVSGSVSNGVHVVDEIRFHPLLPEGELHGIRGRMVRVEEDQLYFVDALGNMAADLRYLVHSGWLQVGPTGRILNEGFTVGTPDFGWVDVGPLDWTRPSSFNGYDVPDLRLSLLINGVRMSDAEREKMAERLNFPPHWRTLIVR